MTERRLIKLTEVQRRTALCRSSIYAKVAAGTFPKPVKNGSSSAWSILKFKAGSTNGSRREMIGESRNGGRYAHYKSYGAAPLDALQRYGDQHRIRVSV